MLSSSEASRTVPVPHALQNPRRARILIIDNAKVMYPDLASRLNAKFVKVRQSSPRKVFIDSEINNFRTYGNAFIQVREIAVAGAIFS